MDIQAKQVKKGKSKEAFIIFDECIDDPDQFSCRELKRLTTQQRHYHITVIFSTQYVNQLPPRMRTMFYHDSSHISDRYGRFVKIIISIICSEIRFIPRFS